MAQDVSNFDGAVYDPPAGWRYGFPKRYEPLPGESIADTLRRDGYPEAEDPDSAAKHCRFWRYHIEETTDNGKG